MINYLFESLPMKYSAFIGVMVAFLLTCFLLKKFGDKLPKDVGRDFALNGKLSAGKPRGAGFIFIMVFAFAAVMFGKVSLEIVIYIVLTIFAMMTGFLDDCAKTPWGRVKKGILDLIIAILVAVTFLHYNSSSVLIAVTGTVIKLNPIVFAILTIILVWASINVTNCADGVDGLSGTLTIITLTSIYLYDSIKEVSPEMGLIILIFIVCILGYLWYNATPSKMLMGDAGSRAMGLFISVAILKTGSPFLYIPFAIVLMLDGGLGLVKITLLKCKIKALTKVRTPLHDHVRKNWDWSNTQAVFRFAIIQIIVSLATIYLTL